MHRKLTILALSLGLFGAVFSFLGVLRIEHMFSEDGVNLGWGKGWSGLFWKSCTPGGIVLIAISFLIELFALLFHQPSHAPQPCSGHTEQSRPIAQTHMPDPRQHTAQSTTPKTD